MTRAVRPLSTLVGAALLWVISAGPLAAQTQSSPALVGTVTSHAEGPMEGVLVGARTRCRKAV